MSGGFELGHKVTWIYQSRAGYGYRFFCKAEVIRVTGKRVHIRVWREATGEPVEKRVKPESLRASIATERAGGQAEGGGK